MMAANNTNLHDGEGDACRRIAAMARVNRALIKAFADVAVVWCRNPIVVPQHCGVVPDFAVLKFRDDGYASRPPVAEDVLLTVDVEGMAIALARIWKARLYAGSGIPECWLIDMIERRMSVHCSPDQKTYRLTRDLGPFDCVAPRFLAGCNVRVADLLLP